MEVDCVALCGENMVGTFNWILAATDVWSGRTEVRAMQNRSARKVLEHAGPMVLSSPFAW